jgi:hypothetical protein
MDPNARNSFLTRALHFPPSTVCTPGLLAQQRNKCVTVLNFLSTLCLPFGIESLLKGHIYEFEWHLTIFCMANEEIAVSNVILCETDENT